MTLLRKRVSREMPVPADHHGRNIVITLDPGPPCMVIFREKGRKTAVEAPVSWLYWQALKAEADRRAREKAKAKKAKKAERGLLSL